MSRMVESPLAMLTTVGVITACLLVLAIVAVLGFRRALPPQGVVSKLDEALEEIPGNPSLPDVSPLHEAASESRVDHVGLRYFPGDFSMVIHIKVADVLASPIVQAGCDGLQGGMLQQRIAELESLTPITAADVEFVTLGGQLTAIAGPLTAKRPCLYVVRTRSHHDPADLLSKVEDRERVEIKGQAYFRLGNGLAVAFPELRTILFGTETDVRYGVQRADLNKVRSPFNWARLEEHLIVTAEASTPTFPRCQTIKLDDDEILFRHKNFVINSFQSTRLKADLERNLEKAKADKKRHRHASRLSPYMWLKTIADMEFSIAAEGSLVEEVARLKGIRSADQCREVTEQLLVGTLLNVAGTISGGLPMVTVQQFVQNYELTQSPRPDEWPEALIPGEPFGTYREPRFIPVLVLIAQYSRNHQHRLRAQDALWRIHDPATIHALLKLAGSVPLVTRPNTEMLEHYLRYGDPATAVAACRLLELGGAETNAVALLQKMAKEPPNGAVRAAATRALANIRAKPPQRLVDVEVATQETNDQLDSLKRTLANVAQRRNRPTQTKLKQMIEERKDAWGRLLRYRAGGDGTYVIASAGPDGRFDTGDDIVRMGETAEN